MIDVDISVRQGRHVILPRTMLTARAGEVTVLTGESGSGKTSLLKALIGAVPEKSEVFGAISVESNECRVLNPLELSETELARFRREHIAFVGQDPGAELPPLMSVARLLRELAPGTDVAALLRRVDLPASIASRRIHQLSGGQQRRVALARALSRSSKAIVLDEPFAGLDSGTSTVIAHLLRDIADSGVTVIFTAHQVPKLAIGIDKVAVVGNGIEENGSKCQIAERQSAGTKTDQILHLVTKDTQVTELSKASIGESMPGAGAGAGASPVLRVSNLSCVNNERVTLFQGLSFAVQRGTMVGVKGPSGSGKSTLLRCLIGLNHAESGEIEIAGVTREAKRTWPRKNRLMMQIVPQDPASTLNPKMTALDAVARAARVSVRGRRDARRAAIDLLDKVGIDKQLAQRKPSGLSGGQRQRVAIARALAVRPKLLLCDEITSALDYQAATKVMSVLQELNSEGMGIVLVSHDDELLQSYCSTVIPIGTAAVG
ncbi:MULTISPECIES: ABC transporter ATP-binding protein [Corynebacterium]|uniref:ABC transporter ATP-binding protein n=1 Tax=Corynebacterium TaxID=1716 RepID=UPI000B10FA8B|nr:ATP-binding cassette domain-containing protein [Corynebacterium sp. HMSC076C10]